MADPQQLDVARRALTAAEARTRSQARIDNAHNLVACPSCRAPIGTLCRQKSGRGRVLADRPQKRAHRARWELALEQP